MNNMNYLDIYQGMEYPGEVFGFIITWKIYQRVLGNERGISGSRHEIVNGFASGNLMRTFFARILRTRDRLVSGTQRASG